MKNNNSSTSAGYNSKALLAIILRVAMPTLLPACAYILAIASVDIKYVRWAMGLDAIFIMAILTAVLLVPFLFSQKLLQANPTLYSLLLMVPFSVCVFFGYRNLFIALIGV